MSRLVRQARHEAARVLFHPLLILWVGSQVLQVIAGITAVRETPDATGRKRIGSLTASAIASVLPLVTLLLFLRVFVIGGSSNVAQLAGEEGFALWSLWCNAWLPLYFGNPIAFSATLIAAFLPPRDETHWHSIASRACAVVGAGCAWYTVVTYFPDA